jgi:predicted permease
MNRIKPRDDIPRPMAVLRPIQDPELRAVAAALHDRYDDLEPLDGGGMADLLVGRERKFDRHVVIKRVASRIATPEARDRFAREIALLASLQHPNIVPLLTADVAHDTPYFVMPLVRGESLATRLARGPLSVREAVAILDDVAQALEVAHAAGVVHRDIKPGNILLTRSAAVVADFGIAKAVSRPAGGAPIPLYTPTDLTLEGFSLGTPRYMSPEQFAADPFADHRVDLYSLGVVAYEMLAGSPPFTGATPSALARAHVAEVPASLRTRRADVPAALDALILQCLAKDPADRPASATDLLRRLRSSTVWQTPEREGTPRDDGLPVSSPVATASRELRQAWRALLRAPRLLVACVFCLAIGLGGAAAIFSVADRVLLRPVDFDHPEQLVSIFRSQRLSATLPWSAPNFLDIAGEPSAAGIAAFSSTSQLIALGDRYQPAAVIRTTGAFFAVLRARPLHGRLLIPADDDPRAPAVVVASFEYWRSHLGGSPTVIGSTVRLDGVPHEVVGVLPPHFHITNGGTTYTGELWLPMRFTPSERAQRTSNWLRVVGRLQPGTAPERLQAALTQRFAPVIAAHAELEGHGISVTPLVEDAGRELKRPLGLFIVATIAVLAIAVINVSSLLLARGLKQQAELAVRIALGATRWQVMRPVFWEGLIIALLGWLSGVLLAMAGLRGMAALGAERVVQLSFASVDVRAIAVALMAALLAAVVGTVAPAWRAARTAPADAIRGARATGSQRQQRTLSALVIIEGALAVTLLIAAGLVTKGFVRLTQHDAGFDPARVLTMRVRVSASDYLSGRAAVQFLAPALDAVARIPGVEAVGAISQLMYSEWGWNSWVRYEGRPEVPPTERPLIETRSVTPGFFAVTGQRLVAGRLLDAREMYPDNAAQRVVVNEALVARDFPDGNAVGQRFLLGDQWIEIIGVVSDVRNFGPTSAPRPEAYWSFAQRYPAAVAYNLVLRSQSADPVSVAGEVERALRGVSPGVAVSRVQPMASLISQSIGWPRFVFALFATLATVALVLALAGLFGILNYTVEQRQREYAVRSALGATPAQIQRQIFARAATLVALSLSAGLTVAWAVTRLMAAMLYGVEPLDPAVWATAVITMLLAGAAAAAAPAWRASRVDLMSAMRVD